MVSLIATTRRGNTAQVASSLGLSTSVICRVTTGSQAGACARAWTGTCVRIPLLTRVLNSLVTADLNRDLNTALRPELGRRLSAVLKLTLKAEFSPDVIARLEPGFRAEVWPVLIAVLKRRFRSVLNCDLRPDFTPEVTPLLITQVPV